MERSHDHGVLRRAGPPPSAPPAPRSVFDDVSEPLAALAVLTRADKKYVYSTDMDMRMDVEGELLTCNSSLLTCAFDLGLLALSLCPGASCPPPRPCMPPP